MKFRMIVKYRDEDAPPWNEDEDRPDITSIEDAKAWAEYTVASFNNAIRPHEKPRELVGVEDLDDGEGSTKKFRSMHNWQKTNLVTIMGKYFGSHDTMECENCGITGKRHGIGDHGVIHDPEFKAPGYASCSQAKILLERRHKMREKKERESK